MQYWNTFCLNISRNIYLSGNILDKYNSTYNNNNAYFEILFQNYTASAVNNIYH